MRIFDILVRAALATLLLIAAPPGFNPAKAQAGSHTIDVSTASTNVANWTVFEVLAGQLISSPGVVGAMGGFDIPMLSFPNNASFNQNDGFWYATFEFDLPANAISPVLNIQTGGVDDRAVYELNGNFIANAPFYDSGQGYMVLTDRGPSVPTTFLYANDASWNLHISKGFVHGTNTITIIVNNTGDGVYGAPCSLSCGGPTRVGFVANVTYQTVANPSPAHAGLVADPNDVLYGVTESGGLSAKGCCGTAFALTPPAAGQTAWTKATLYSFKGGADGDAPQAGLLLGSDGGLYGTTRHGGIEGQFGTLYELSPPVAPATAWTEAILYSFGGGVDGYYPDGGLIQGLDGSLYGVTRDGGTGSCHDPAGGAVVGCGTVFALTPPASGQTAWTKSTVYSFKGSDGQSPTSGLWIDGSGALYGATLYGGAHTCLDPATGTIAGCGAIFRLTPPVSGQTAWTETTLYSFKHDRYGSFPRTALVGDALGHLYGTAELITGQGGGTVFELKPPYAQKTGWTPYLIGQIPHYGPAFGAEPAANDLAIDKTGTLYFTASSGGGAAGCGALGCGSVYALTPPPKGSGAAWTLADLADFQGGDSATGDGALPEWGLALGSDGTLFGVTKFGGTGSCGLAPDIGCGAAFTLTPPAAGETGWTEAVPYRFQGGGDGYSP